MNIPENVQLLSLNAGYGSSATRGLYMNGLEVVISYLNIQIFVILLMAGEKRGPQISVTTISPL